VDLVEVGGDEVADAPSSVETPDVRGEELMVEGARAAVARKGGAIRRERALEITGAPRGGPPLGGRRESADV